MNFLEIEIEDMICSALDKDASILSKRGLYINPNYIRQLNLGSYGIADIVCFSRDSYRNIEIQVIELKKDLIDNSVLMQAAEYVTGIKRILEKDWDINNHTVTFEIILIGKKIQTSGNFTFLADACSNVRLYTYTADIENGVRFNQQSGFFQHNEMRGVFTQKNLTYIKSKLFINNNPF